MSSNVSPSGRNGSWPRSGPADSPQGSAPCRQQQVPYGVRGASPTRLRLALKTQSQRLGLRGERRIPWRSLWAPGMPLQAPGELSAQWRMATQSPAGFSLPLTHGAQAGVPRSQPAVPRAVRGPSRTHTGLWPLASRLRLIHQSTGASPRSLCPLARFRRTQATAGGYKGTARSSWETDNKAKSTLVQKIFETHVYGSLKASCPVTSLGMDFEFSLHSKKLSFNSTFQKLS